VIRRSYTPNLEGGPVALVMEFLSETEAGEYSLRPLYPYGKLYFYETILQIPTYVIFDPATATLEVRTLQAGQYALAQPDQQGRFWIAEMGLFLGSWYGERLGKTIHWLRWWDQAGNLLLWSRERAEQERQRAEQEQARAEQAEQAGTGGPERTPTGRAVSSSIAGFRHRSGDGLATSSRTLHLGNSDDKLRALVSRRATF
jgi:hypothetical protein